MAKKSKKIDVAGTEVTIVQVKQEEYVSITDIAKYKNSEAPADIVKNWLRSKNTIELLGLWEKLNNPDFKLVEFDQFKNEAGFNHFVLDALNMSLFGKTAKQWRDENPDEKGNIRDYVNVSQLVCLANMESLNAVFINEGLEQPERLTRLNQIAISQMKILLKDRVVGRLGNE